MKTFKGTCFQTNFAKSFLLQSFLFIFFSLFFTVNVHAFNYSKVIKKDLDLDGIAERIELKSGNEKTLKIWRGKKLLWDGIPKKWKPWDLQIADVDGDGKSEIILGIFKSTKFFPKPHNCLFIYTWTGEKVVPKWLGSSLGRPFLQFAFSNLDKKKGDELIALEKKLNGNKTISIYKWNGFGFTLEKEKGNWKNAENLKIEKDQIYLKAENKNIYIDTKEMR